MEFLVKCFCPRQDDRYVFFSGSRQFQGTKFLEMRLHLVHDDLSPAFFVTAWCQVTEIMWVVFDRTKKKTDVKCSRIQSYSIEGGVFERNYLGQNSVSIPATINTFTFYSLISLLNMLLLWPILLRLIYKVLKFIQAHQWTWINVTLIKANWLFFFENLWRNNCSQSGGLIVLKNIRFNFSLLWKCFSQFYHPMNAINESINHRNGNKKFEVTNKISKRLITAGTQRPARKEVCLLVSNMGL